MGAQCRGLQAEIEVCRDEMVQLASKTSLTSQKVLETSEKLDRLLNEYTQYKKESSCVD